jgi:hypothetical protein
MSTFALLVKCFFSKTEFELFCERASIKADGMATEKAEFEAYLELRARRP